MQVKVNKKIFKIIISIVIIVAIAVVAIGVVFPMVKFNQMKNKLSQINAEELETKIIQELEKTPLCIKDSTTIDKGMNINNLKDYVIALTMSMEDDEIYTITTPLFKINSDTSGNFKSIEYVSHYIDLGINIENVIFNVLKSQYNIDINYSHQRKLTKNNQNSISIGSSSDKALVWYVNEISPSDRYSNLDNKSNIQISAYANEIETNVKTQYFGIDN